MLPFFQDFFRGGNLLLCKFFYCFRAKFGGAKVSEGSKLLEGVPPAPCGGKPICGMLTHFIPVADTYKSR